MRSVHFRKFQAQLPGEEAVAGAVAGTEAIGAFPWRTASPPVISVPVW
jgi:hypothetical protein